jgi:hypothetical protein
MYPFALFLQNHCVNQEAKEFSMGILSFKKILSEPLVTGLLKFAGPLRRVFGVVCV